MPCVILTLNLMAFENSKTVFFQLHLEFLDGEYLLQPLSFKNIVVDVIWAMLSICHVLFLNATRRDQKAERPRLKTAMKA